MRSSIPAFMTVVALVATRSARPSAAPEKDPAPASAAIAPAPAPAPATARATAETGINQILLILRDTTLEKHDRIEKFRKTINDFVDFDTLSRLSLGGAWKELTDAQRTEFVAEFRNHMLAILTKGTKGFDNEEVFFLGDQQEQRGDWTVMTRIFDPTIGPQGKEIALVNIRFRQKEEQWKVIDVSIKGISMAATFRAQFLVIMKDGGIEKVLKIMRDKNAAAGVAAGEKPPRTADGDK